MIVPSLPAASFEELIRLATSLRGVAPELQIDIVDGVFVPAVSWPFIVAEPVRELEKVEQFTKDFSVEMDCMVMNPEQYLDLFVAMGVARVVVHMGSTEAYQDIFEHAKKHKYLVGLALMNDRPLEALYTHIHDISFVQLMGIETIGKQGQPFDERTIERVKILRARYPELEIAVDGSVNKETILRLHDAGVTRFAPGSAITKSDNQKEAYLELCSMVTKGS